MGKNVVVGSDGKEYVMKEKKPFYKKWWFIVLVIFVVLALVFGGKGDKAANTGGVSTSESQSEAPKNAKVGEMFTLKNSEVGVLSVEVLDEVGEDILKKEASDGGVFVAVVWQMKNVSDKPLSMFETPDIALIDSKGSKYDNDIEATSYFDIEKQIDNSKILSDLNPGILVKATAVYEVSKDLFNLNDWKLKIEEGSDSKLIDLQ